MDELNVFELHQKVPKQRTEQKRKNTKFCKNLSLSRGGIHLGIFLGRLGRGIVLNVNVLGIGLEKRTGSSIQIKLDGAEVYFKEVFNSVQPEILKTYYEVAIQ